jgi:DNA-binding NarL/FixJ family response regulator
MIRVLIADDHVIVRHGLKQLFELMGDITVAGEATDSHEVMAALQHPENFDLILLDLTMPGSSGVGLISQIIEMDIKPPVLVLSMHNEIQIAKRALQSGASGYVTKGSMQEILIDAIRKIAAGGRFVDPLIADQLMFERSPKKNVQLHETLSAREMDIFIQVAKGKSLNEIAEELFISNKTVSTHKARLMEKMNFQSNSELVRYASDNHLIE